MPPHFDPQITLDSIGRLGRIVRDYYYCHADRICAKKAVALAAWTYAKPIDRNMLRVGVRRCHNQNDV